MTALRGAVALAVAYATLAVLVAADAFTAVDQWAVEHLMPSSSFHHGRPGWLEAAVPLLHQRFDSPPAVAADIVTLPAAALVSLAIVVVAWRVTGGLGLVAAWAFGSAVELLCKHVLVRPALYDGSFHVAAFDSSFPSGHALRAVLVACAVTRMWPRTRRASIVWVVASVVLLLRAGWHTPTDLAGGLLLGGLAALALVGGRRAGALRARGLLDRP